MYIRANRTRPQSKASAQNGMAVSSHPAASAMAITVADAARLLSGDMGSMANGFGGDAFCLRVAGGAGVSVAFDDSCRALADLSIKILFLKCPYDRARTVPTP